MIHTPFLRTSRAFPPDIEKISIEINKAYIDIANAVNARDIGLYPTNRPSVNGQSWYFDRNNKQQGLRQIYPFTTAPANVAHGISVGKISGFSNCYGSYTDGTNWYGAMWGSNTAIVGQVSFYLDGTDIVILSGAGAPTVTRGIIVLEWLSQV